MVNFQQVLPEYLKQIGWSTKKVISGEKSFMLELKKDSSTRQQLRLEEYRKMYTLKLTDRPI
jgi:hypothetical protein